MLLDLPDLLADMSDLIEHFLAYSDTGVLCFLCLQIQDGVWTVFLAALVLISARQGEAPEKVPMPEQLDALVQFPLGSVQKMEGQVRMALNHDTAAISAIRVMKLYFERLGYSSKVRHRELWILSLQ